MFFDHFSTLASFLSSFFCCRLPNFVLGSSSPIFINSTLFLISFLGKAAFLFFLPCKSVRRVALQKKGTYSEKMGKDFITLRFDLQSQIPTISTITQIIAQPRMTLQSVTNALTISTPANISYQNSRLFTGSTSCCRHL